MKNDLPYVYTGESFSVIIQPTPQNLVGTQRDDQTKD